MSSYELLKCRASMVGEAEVSRNRGGEGASNLPSVQSRERTIQRVSGGDPWGWRATILTRAAGRFGRTSENAATAFGTLVFIF